MNVKLGVITGLLVCVGTLVSGCATEQEGKLGFAITQKRIDNRAVEQREYRNTSIQQVVEAVAQIFSKQSYVIRTKLNGPIGLVYAYRNKCNPAIDIEGCAGLNFEAETVDLTEQKSPDYYSDPEILKVPVYGRAAGHPYTYYHSSEISRHDSIISVTVTPLQEKMSVRVRMVVQFVSYYANGVEHLSCNIVDPDCNPDEYPAIYDNTFKELDTLLGEKGA